MNRLSFPAIKNQNQKGIDVVDAIFAMIIASMIAAAVATSLGTWFNMRTLTASEDGASQYAQGVIARTSAVEWSKLGFAVPATTPTPVNLMSDQSGLDCDTQFRPSIQVDGTTLNTVTLATASDTGLAQTAVAEVRGQKYCVTTDVTWNDPADTSTTSPRTYGTKNVSVKVSWEDRGVAHSISVDATRSPNIGEAIPTGISQGHDAEVSPLKSFVITKADNDGTNGRICYTGDWNATSDSVTVVGSTSTSLSPEGLSQPLSDSDKGVEKCLTVSGTPAYSFYGLKVSDSAGVKFTGTAAYQFPGSQLTQTGNDLSWTTYPSTGTITYRVMQSSSADFSNPTLLKETTDSTYTMPDPTSAVWLRVDTVSSDYAVTAQSNVIAVPAPTPTATPTSTATPTATDTSTATATPSATATPTP